MDIPRHGTLEMQGRGLPLPGRRGAGAQRHHLRHRGRPHDGDRGQHRRRQDHLVSLVPRLFDATSGSVLVDGVDVRELEPARLWDSIGLVPQKPYLFSGTVASNLLFGKPDATEAEMWEALEVAQAADFVRDMPGQLEARIEQGGTNVSGGQRQRLSIARALVRRPSIYLFDDSFSALDLTTDARLRAALKPYTSDAAVVIVAQRVSTIADRRRHPRARRRPPRRVGAPTRSSSSPAPPTPRSCSPRSASGAAQRDGDGGVRDRRRCPEGRPDRAGHPGRRPLELRRHAHRALGPVRHLGQAALPPARDRSARSSHWWPSPRS